MANNLVTIGGTFSRTLGRDPHRPQLGTGCTNAFNGVALTAFGYGYDALSRATNRNDDAFAYNARSELTGAVLLTNCYGYVYDSIGNRLFSVLNSATNTYAANSLNQYTAVTGGSPTYDADGNMTWDGKFVHSWDSENRLTKSHPGGTVTNGSVMVENRYDYLHRRVSKAVRRLTGRGPGYPLDPSQAGTWALVETRAFVYDGWNLIRETVSDTNGVTGVTEYFWGPDLSGTLQGAGGVGGLLAVSMNGLFYFPCYDNNGNVIAYAGENGTLRAEYAYDAFGNTVAQTGDMADAFSYRFSTKYWDEETGLYYYGYRFYSPEFGRWLNRDPIGEREEINLYGFVNNDGLSAWDFLGWFSEKGYTMVSSVITADQTSCPETQGAGGIVSAYEILFSKEDGTGRLEIIGFPKELRKDFAKKMVRALNMTSGYYYDLHMSLRYWKKEEIVTVEKSICPSGKKRSKYHVVEMESPDVSKHDGYVHQFDDVQAKKGKKVVTPALPTHVGPVETCECIQ